MKVFIEAHQEVLQGVLPALLGILGLATRSALLAESRDSSRNKCDVGNMSAHQPHGKEERSTGMTELFFFLLSCQVLLQSNSASSNSSSEHLARNRNDFRFLDNRIIIQLWTSDLYSYFLCWRVQLQWLGCQTKLPHPHLEIWPSQSKMTFPYPVIRRCLFPLWNKPKGFCLFWYVNESLQSFSIREK